MLATGWDLKRNFSQKVRPDLRVVLPLPHSMVTNFQNSVSGAPGEIHIDFHVLTLEVP